MATVLYEKKPFWVCAENGGFAVYETGITHSTRCAQIGYKGEEGFRKAIAEADKRAQALTSKGWDND